MFKTPVSKLGYDTIDLGGEPKEKPFDFSCGSSLSNKEKRLLLATFKLAATTATRNKNAVCMCKIKESKKKKKRTKLRGLWCPFMFYCTAIFLLHVRLFRSRLLAHAKKNMYLCQSRLPKSKI